MTASALLTNVLWHSPVPHNVTSWYEDDADVATTRGVELREVASMA